jgi:predicted small secreted protein
MNAWITKLLGALCLAALLTTLLGCNTVKGVGQDIQDVSDNVREAMSD